MAGTLLEQTRALHEDLERLERLIVKDFKQDAKSHKEKLNQNHRVRKRLDTMQESARKLVKIYQDDDGSRKEEISNLAGNNTNVFSKFYDRLKEVREYHRRFPSTEVAEAEDDEALLKEEPYVEWTGEEQQGRCLDLHEHYLRFINEKFGRKIEYYEYVTELTNFAAIPRSAKMNKAYREYLQKLQAYLVSFLERAQPLVPVDKQMAKIHDEFPQQFEAGQVAGWEDKGVSTASSSGSGLDLEAFDSVEELETIGAERLKEALQALGLKCGGTPRERAQRLFLTKTTPLEQLDKKLFAKGVVAPATAKNPEDVKKVEQAACQVALLEALVARLGEMLAQQLADTKGRIEKKQAQTYEEMLAEQEEAEAEVAVDDDEEEEEYIYNPLKLPLGWDGKPIPYWLYKLHGLNQEFKCEICGNYSYWGRRAFERHFKEWRHQNGMRALGLPNNKMFYEVTKIEEAQLLWRTIQEKSRGGFKAEVEEEFEDASGNVYNRKTYEDMKRQGLI